MKARRLMFHLTSKSLCSLPSNPVCAWGVHLSLSHIENGLNEGRIWTEVCFGIFVIVLNHLSLLYSLSPTHLFIWLDVGNQHRFNIAMCHLLTGVHSAKLIVITHLPMVASMAGTMACERWWSHKTTSCESGMRKPDGVSNYGKIMMLDLNT